MNILFISHTASRAGAEMVSINAIKTIANNNIHNIYLALPNDGNDAFEKQLGSIVSKCRVERFAYRPIRTNILLSLRNLAYGLLLGLPKLVKFIKQNDIDLVYVNSSVNVIGLLAARIARKPHIWHIHEQIAQKHRWTPKWFNLFYRRWFCNAQCTPVFISNTCYNLWLKDLKIDTIANKKVLYSQYRAVEPSRKNNSNICFGYIGSLSRYKNVSMIIDAFNLFYKANFGCKLLIGGSGDLELQLKERAKDNASIEFLGQVTNVSEFYSKIDCLVIPSLNESWGLVALEAMSAQVPVIITKNSGIVELLENGKDCIFVEPTDIKDIVKAMRMIADNPDFASKLCLSATVKLAELDMNNKFPEKLLSIINGTIK